jgi:hypothetical protein
VLIGTDRPRIDRRASDSRRRTTADDGQTSARLAEADARIQAIASRVLQARVDTRVRVERRVKALLDRQRSLRTTSQLAVEGHAFLTGSPIDVQREIQSMDVEIALAEAQLDMDSARDRETFDAAVVRQIEAYRGLAALQQASGKAGTLVESLRSGIKTASARLQRYRALSTQVSDSLRAGVLVALDDLDGVEADLQAESRTRTEGGSTLR